MLSRLLLCLLYIYNTISMVTYTCCYNGPGGCSVPVPRSLAVIPGEIASVLGLQAGARGHACDHHAKVHVCSLQLVCKGAAKSWWDSRGYHLLTENHCELASKNIQAMSDTQVLARTAPARVCNQCHKQVLGMPTKEFRRARYRANEAATGSTVYCCPGAQGGADVEWILALDGNEHDCPTSVKSCFVLKDKREFLVCVVNGTATAVRPPPSPPPPCMPRAVHEGLAMRARRR